MRTKCAISRDELKTSREGPRADDIEISVVSADRLASASNLFFIVDDAFRAKLSSFLISSMVYVLGFEGAFRTF